MSSKKGKKVSMSPELVDSGMILSRDISFQQLEGCIETADITKLLEILSISRLTINNTNSEGDTILNIACKINVNARLILALLKHDANPNIKNHYGKIPLHCAVLNRSLKTALCLVKYHSEIDIVDIFGNTPLHYACMTTQHLQMVKLLLGKGANANITVPHQMPLFAELALHVYDDNSLDIITYLIKHDVDVFIQDRITKKTALHIASITGNCKLATKLLKKRLDPLQLDTSGYSPLMLARMMRYYSLISLYDDYLYYLDVLKAIKDDKFNSFTQ